MKWGHCGLTLSCRYTLWPHWDHLGGVWPVEHSLVVVVVALGPMAVAGLLGAGLVDEMSLAID